MSKIAIKGNESGTATFTIEAPATNTDRIFELPDEAGKILTDVGVPTSAMPAGSVLQVVQTVKTDRFTTTNATFTNITGYSASITPTSTSSKILVISSFHVSGGDAGSYPRARLLRGDTALGLGDSTGGSATNITATTSITNSLAPDCLNVSYTYLDSPNTTSATTYQWQLAAFLSRPAIFNGSDGNPASNYYNTSSTITLMEIAG